MIKNNFSFSTFNSSLHYNVSFLVIYNTYIKIIVKYSFIFCFLLKHNEKVCYSYYTKINILKSKYIFFVRLSLRRFLLPFTMSGKKLLKLNSGGLNFSLVFRNENNQ